MLTGKQSSSVLGSIKVTSYMSFYTNLVKLSGTVTLFTASLNVTTAIMQENLATGRITLLFSSFSGSAS